MEKLYLYHKSFMRQEEDTAHLCVRCEKKTKFELTTLLMNEWISISHGICEECEKEVLKDID